MESITDEGKRKWIERFAHDNSNVRKDWIKRTDGRLGYLYLKNPNYIIRGDFVKRGGVYRRIWIPCYMKWQIHELQFSSDLEVLMQKVEKYVLEAGEQCENEYNPQDAESI